MALPRSWLLCGYGASVAFGLATIALLSAGAAAAGVRGGVTCESCHEDEARQFRESAHRMAGFSCRECHGGAETYRIDLARVQRYRDSLATRPEPLPPTSRQTFDHGPAFTGRSPRGQIPERCGQCHSDVARMNPYGLPTDQLAQYRLSGHGRSLYEKKDERVAVCTDCHGVHAILRPTDSAAAVHPRNIPETCGRCHADPAIMSDSGRSTRVVDEYKASVHGKGLLEGGDTGMPHCATCHGSHSAVPPGYKEVGHVCGRCHQQEEKQFVAGPHDKFPRFPRCVGCHVASLDHRDHRIDRVVASPDTLKKTYAEVVPPLRAQGADDEALQQAFWTRRTPSAEHYADLCQRCHHSSAQVAHRALFGELDKEAARIGQGIYAAVRRAEWLYASTAHRVEQVGRGVLLVTNEAMQLEELRTRLVAIGPLQHTLDLEKVDGAVKEIQAAAGQINSSLDQKERGLEWRYWTLIPMWGFIAVFAGALWVKFKRLKRVWVAPLPDSHRE